MFIQRIPSMGLTYSITARRSVSSRPLIIDDSENEGYELSLSPFSPIKFLLHSRARLYLRRFFNVNRLSSAAALSSQTK